MRLLFTSTLLLTTPLLAQRFPEIEPNDTPATAQVVATGTQIDGALLAADNDWYSVTTTGGQVRMTISGTTDTRLNIWDALGTVTLAGNDDSRGLQSDITLNLAAGTYLVQVFGFSATTAGPYSLDIANETPAKPFTAVEAEPNDLLAQAQLIALPAQVNGSLSGPADIDIYQVVLPAPRTGIFLQITEGDAPWVSQHRFEILDAAGALVPATLGTNAGNSGTFTFRTATTRCWPAGTYHIVVRNTTAVLTYNPVPVGNYRLEVLDLPENIGGVVGEAAEPNSTIATATPIAPGQQGTGNVTINTGTDISDLWGPITLSGPSVIQIQTGAGVGTPMTDSTVRILQVDPLNPTTLLTALTATSGNVLEGTGLHARTTVTFFVPSLTYYIAVDSPGVGAGMSGDYVLEYSVHQPAMYVASSYFIAASNAGCGIAPIPTLTRQFTNEAPTVGQTFSRQLTGLVGPGNLGLLIQGTDQTNPLDWGVFFGHAPGTCFLNVNAIAISVVIGNPAGVAELSLTIPANVSLRSAILWEQGVKLDPLATPSGFQTGNYARILVGERSY